MAAGPGKFIVAAGPGKFIVAVSGSRRPTINLQGLKSYFLERKHSRSPIMGMLHVAQNNCMRPCYTRTTLMLGHTSNHTAAYVENQNIESG